MPVLTPGHIDEPQAVSDYAEVLTRVAEGRQPVVVRREGVDLAAVVPLEYLEMVQDLLARQEAERQAAGVNWGRLAETSPPAPEWFEQDEPKPF